MSAGLYYVLLQFLYIFPWCLQQGDPPGWHNYVAFVTASLFLLFLGRVGWYVSLVGGVVQVLNLGNLLTLKYPIYASQVFGFLHDPLAAIAMVGAEVTDQTHLLVLSYLALIIILWSRSKGIFISAVKLWPRQWVICGIVGSMFTAQLIPSLGALLDYSHPVIFSVHIGNPQTVTFHIERNLVEPGEPRRLMDDSKPSLIVLVMGESQTHFGLSGISAVLLPNITHAENSGQLKQYTNFSPSGAYTSVSYKQVLDVSYREDFDKPHSSIYQYANKAGYKGVFVSSRNKQWGALKALADAAQESFDCTDVNEHCSILEGEDDRLVLDELILGNLVDDTFILWQMNGSHVPLHDKSPSSYKVTDDEYKNSVHYTDAVLGELFTKMPENALVFYMADHARGNRGEVQFVPAFVYSKDEALLSQFNSATDAPFMALDMMNTIVQIMGFEQVEPFYDMREPLLHRDLPRKILLTDGIDHYLTVPESPN